MRMRCSPLLILIAGLLFAPSAQAGCPNPNANGGQSPEGAVVYNADHKVMQFCDGAAWWAMKNGGGLPSCAAGDTIVMTSSGWGCGAAGSGLSGPAGCANIGDLCADGTVFAGWHPITQEHLFIPTTDQGTTSQWKTSIGTDDIATDSTYDGRANTNQVANSTTFPAFKLCKDLGTGGHADWYLPSQVELYYLWSVHETIEAGGSITNFQNAFYWSSTEYNANGAWTQSFTDGLQNTSNETSAYRVRCVRR